jgi:omega-amidase
MTEMTEKLDIHLVQFSIIWEDQEKNYAKVLSLLRKNPPKKGSVICLPELFSTGYTPAPHRFAEKIKGSATIRFLRAIAREFSSFVIGSAVLHSSESSKPFNSAVALSPDGEIISRYDKIHLLPLGKEARAYGKGRKISMFRVKNRLFSIFICFDLRFPELFRSAYDRDVDGIFILANWPSVRQRHWEILTKARAVENQCYIFGVNRTGRDPYSSYKGGSCIIHPSGEALATSQREGILSCRVSLKETAEERKMLPFKKSRRTTVYKNYPPYR